MKNAILILLVLVCSAAANAQMPPYPVRITNGNNCVVLIVEEYCLSLGTCSTLPSFGTFPQTGTPLPVQVTTVTYLNSYSAQNGSIGSLCASPNEYYYRVAPLGPGPDCEYLPLQWLGDGPCANNNSVISQHTPSSFSCPCGSITLTTAVLDSGLYCEP